MQVKFSCSYVMTRMREVPGSLGFLQRIRLTSASTLLLPLGQPSSAIHGRPTLNVLSGIYFFFDCLVFQQGEIKGWLLPTSTRIRRTSQSHSFSSKTQHVQHLPFLLFRSLSSPKSLSDIHPRMNYIRYFIAILGLWQ